MGIMAFFHVFTGDGTFGAAPVTATDGFLQLYTIMGIVHNQLLPLIYCLLCDKAEDTYKPFVKDTVKSHLNGAIETCESMPGPEHEPTRRVTLTQCWEQCAGFWCSALVLCSEHQIPVFGSERQASSCFQVGVRSLFPTRSYSLRCK